MRKYILSFIVISLLSVITVLSQVPDPVKWKFSSEKKENVIELIFTADIEAKWYMYATDFPEGGPIPTSVAFDESDKFELVGNIIEVTPSKEKYDEVFEINIKLFKKQAVLKQLIKPLTDDPFEIRGSVEFMSCNNTQCLPPDDEEFVFSYLDGDVTSENIIPEDNGIQTAVLETNIGVSLEGDDNENSTEDKSLLGFFITAFLLGFVGLLTPCVYPMIPMTVSFFMRDAKNRFRAIMNGLIFGLSITAIYTSIGLIVSLTSASADFVNNLSTHWISNTIFFLIFLVFAASFFGMFEIMLPASLTNKVDKQADKGGYLGTFFMALALVVVSFSCTGIFVGGILMEAVRGAVLKPTIGMFGFGFAFALPFTLLAIFPSMLKNLPKSGGWLNSVKVVMAFVLLAFGLKFISSIDQSYHLNLLSRDVFIAIWIVIFVLMGFYLLGKIKFSHDSELKHVGFFRLLLVIASFTFAIYLIPGLFGAPLKPLAGLLPPITSQEFDLSTMKTTHTSSSSDENKLCSTPKYADFLHLPHGLKGYFDYEQGMACAKEMNKPVLLDFKGHSCSKCKEMEEKVWSDPRVIKKLKEDYIIIALYVDDRSKLPESEWVTSKLDGKVKKFIGKKNADFQASKYNISAQPYYVLIDSEGKELVSPTAYDLDIDKFIDFLDKGAKEFAKSKVPVFNQMTFGN